MCVVWVYRCVCMYVCMCVCGREGNGCVPWECVGRWMQLGVGCYTRDPLTQELESTHREFHCPFTMNIWARAWLLKLPDATFVHVRSLLKEYHRMIYFLSVWDGFAVSWDLDQITRCDGSWQQHQKMSWNVWGCVHFRTLYSICARGI